MGNYPEGASPYGVLDMAGNVAEWVSDLRSRFYYENSPSINPQGPESGDSRNMRGGSWNPYPSYYDAFGVRSASRSNSGTARGFRCAVSVEMKPVQSLEEDYTITPKVVDQQSVLKTQSPSDTTRPANPTDPVPTAQPTIEPTNTPKPPPTNTPVPPPPTNTAACSFDDPNWPCN